MQSESSPQVESKIELPSTGIFRQVAVLISKGDTELNDL
jgi:hypothetical protein